MIDQKIMHELYKTVEFLLENCNFPIDKLGILAAIGSYNDTLLDKEILSLIKNWNQITIKHYN